MIPDDVAMLRSAHDQLEAALAIAVRVDAEWTDVDRPRDRGEFRAIRDVLTHSRRVCRGLKTLAYALQRQA